MGHGGLKMLSKNTCERVNLMVKLPAKNLQACKFTKHFDGAVSKKNIRWEGAGGALTLENPGPILHVAGVLDAPLILLF